MTGNPHPLKTSKLSRRLKTSKLSRRAIVILIGAILGWLGTRGEKEYKLRVSRQDEQYLIKVLLEQKLQGQADGLTLHRLEHNEQSLVSIWQYAPDRRSDQYKISNFNQSRDPELFQQLELGNCQDRSIARSGGGVLLPAIICPIFKAGELVGTISAFYGELYPLPLLNNENIRDPDAGLLFRAGDRIAWDD